MKPPDEERIQWPVQEKFKNSIYY